MIHEEEVQGSHMADIKWVGGEVMGISVSIKCGDKSVT